MDHKHSMGPTQGETESLRTVAMESLSLIDDLLHKLDDPFPNSLDSILEDDHQQKPCINIPNGFNRIPDGDNVSELIKNRLVSSLSACGLDARVEAIYRNGFSSVMGQVRLRCFRLYVDAVEKNCDGDANVKHAWYGASKKVIQDILRFGFGFESNNGVGKGIYLSAVDHAIESMQHAPADEDGARHMLICRVILGNMEVISPFPGQNEPSSLKFDSGVDNKLYPKKYILWATRMNTHILPEYVVNFRTTNRGGSLRNLQPSKAANASATWAATVEALSRILNADAMEFVSNQYDKYMKHKITKQELVRSLRGVVEDRFFVSLKKYPTKKVHNSEASSQIANNPRRNRAVPQEGTTSMTSSTMVDTSLGMLITPIDHPPPSIIRHPVFKYSSSLQQSQLSTPGPNITAPAPLIRPPFMQPSASSKPNVALPHDSQITYSTGDSNKGKKPRFDFRGLN